MTKLRRPMDQSIESITKRLQTDDSEAPMLLLQRAQLYADEGDEANAKADIASAASLVKEPRHRTDQMVAAVERAFRDITISPTEQPGALKDPLLAKYTALSVNDLVDAVVKWTKGGKLPDQEAVAMVGALGNKADSPGKPVTLDARQICSLVDAFHTTAVVSADDASDNCVFAKGVARCIKSVVLHLAAANTDDEGKTGGPYTIAQASICILKDAAKAIQTAWETHDTDGSFKQRACRYGASMYMSVAYAMATYSDPQKAELSTDLSTPLRDTYEFYIQQVWMVGTLQVATADEVGEVSQGILRLLTANKPLFVYLFITASSSDKKGSKTPVNRLLHMLGTTDEALSPSEAKGRSLALLIATQLVGAAKDPENSVMFPEHDTAKVSQSRAQARAAAPTAASTRLRSEVVQVVDEWIQSTVQLERSRGLLSAASLYEGGIGSDLLADLWLKSGWAEDLWDQGEFDKPETQLSLLRLADASSTDVSVGKQMKSVGNGLVQELAKGRNVSKRGTDIVAELAASASVVLAKWSGMPVPAPKPGGKMDEANSGVELAGDNPVPMDADPIDLANVHMERVASSVGKSASADTLNSSVEKAVEALGFLCLKPKVKEHVAHNEGFLQTLFSLGQKTTSVSLRFSIVMLIRNLTMYRPVLSEEQKRMQQLQHLGKKAQSGAGENAGQTVGDDLKQEEEGEDPKLDAPDAVSKRALAACKCGGVAVLVSSVQPKLRPSDSVKDAVAEIVTSLAVTQSLRGLIVQQGGVRALLGILTDSAPKATAKSSQAKDGGYVPKALLQKRDKDIAFSLAKIAISVPPNLAFQDPREIVQLLLSLLLEDTETQALLMKFESLLALTNLASVEPGSSYDVREYMAISLNGISSIEMLMLSNHPLVRRAATELLCNLVYSPKVFERYVSNADEYVPESIAAEEMVSGGELLPSGIVELPSDDEEEEKDSAKKRQPEDGDKYRSHRLHLLVALADVEDAATRSAAAGALAILSNDPQCCRYLFLAHPRACDVLVRLANNDDGDTEDSEDNNSTIAFKHRVAVVWANAANCGDARVLLRLRREKDVAGTLKDMVSDPMMPFFAAAKDAIQKIKGA
ncbi:SWI5-dependent HO expression protein 4, partial [Coemansia sp. RSA 1933]